MNRLINSLPIEIIHHILSYSYKPQPVKLQNDIISYVRTKREIQDIFYRRYLTMDYHFTFHIQCFLKGLPNTYANCADKQKEVCNRIFMYYKINTNSQLTYCVFWGLLKPEERDHFLKIQKEMDSTQMP